MQASSQAFAAAIAGAVGTATYTVTITGLTTGAYGPDFSLAVDALEVDRSTVTDMPDGTRLIIGYPSAQATVTLSGYVYAAGTWKTIAWLLNPAQTDSPMYRYDALGAAVTIQAGLALQGQTSPEQFTIFTGYIDDYSVDMQQGTVTLTCLDPKTKLTGAPTCPPAYDDGTTASLGPLFSVYALEQIVRPFGVRSRPAYRSGCVCAVSGRQGMAADTGYGSQLSYTSPTVTTGSWRPIGSKPPQHVTATLDGIPYYAAGSGNAPGAAGSASYATAGAGVPTNSPCFIEYWSTVAQGKQTVLASQQRQTAIAAIYDSPSKQNGVSVQLATLSGTDTVIVNFVAGGVATALTTPVSGGLVADGTSSYIGVQFTWTGTSGAATVRYRGQTYNLSGTVGSRVAGAWDTVFAGAPTFAFATTGAQYSVWDSLQVTTESAGSSTFNDGFVSGVDLDLSLNALTVIPDLTGADIWTTIQAIAEAEMGVAGFTETGIFQFLNRDTLRTATPVRTLTPTYSLKTLAQQVGNSFVRNHIQVPVAAVQVQAFSTVWQATDAVYIGPGEVYTIVATATDSVIGLATTCGLIPSGGLVSTSGYRASKNPDATTAVTNLTMTVAQTGPTTITVTVTNPNGFGVYLITPSGAGYPAGSIGMPALAVGGHSVIPAGAVVDTTTGQITANQIIADWQWPPASEGGAITNPRGEQLLPVQANAWIQSSGMGDALAQALGEDLYRPKPLWRNVSIVADPRLQIVDRVTVNDPDTTGVNDDARIFGITTRLSKTDWSMDCDLRALSTPGGWLIGQPGRSEIGATTWI